MIPPAPNAVGGGNAFQGLGRSDDPGPSRLKEYGYPTYNSSTFNATGENFPPPVIESNSYARYTHTDTPPTASTNATNSPPVSSPTGMQSSFIPTSMLDSPIAPPQNYYVKHDSNNGVDPGSFYDRSPRYKDSGVDFSNASVRSTRPIEDPNAPPPVAVAPIKNARSAVKIKQTKKTPVPARSQQTETSAEEPGTGGTASETQQAETEPDTIQPGKTPLSPLNSALEDVKAGFYPHALSTVDQILKTNPENADAHYLKAIILVYKHDFAIAKNEYQATIKYSHSDQLKERARAGLEKLTR